LQFLGSANLGRDFSLENPFGDGRGREIIRERAQDSGAIVLVFE